MNLPSSTSKTTWIYAVLVLFLVAYAAIRVVNLSQAAQKVKATADTPAYVRISKESVLADKFLAGARPLVFPLFLKLLGNDVERVVWAQGVFSIISWSVLAVSIAYSLQIFFLQFAAFGLTLLLSLNRYIIGWDSVLLTESLSLSLMALFLAGWLWLVRGWRWEKAGFLVVVALLWAFCRDTNAWVLLMIGLFLALLVIPHVAAKKYLVLSTAFLIIFLLSNLSADLGERWVFPFQNVVGRRILPSVQAVDYFAGCGMPVSPALLQLKGQYANGLDRAFYEDPALTDYRAWLYQDGKTCYMKWLLSRPLESLRAPLSEFNTLISLGNIQPFLFSRSFSPVLPARLEMLLYPQHYLLILFALTWGIVLVAVLTKAWTHNKTWWVVLGLNILVLPHYFITWHGDIMGIYRHVLGVSIQFYLGLWLLVLLGLDSLLALKTIQMRLTNRLSMENVK
ncbi:MAG TPA: hypothetical protein VK897_09140 [Anaerolineales bacterium]|nr:hypothetical protein [Anaerolineales bacterium]